MRPFLVRKFFKKLIRSILFFRSTLIKCLSPTENSIVFIVINNNNPTPQIITLSQNINGLGVVVNLKIELATVSVIHMQKL